MENITKSVRIFESKSNYHHGVDLGAGFAVIVEPLPITSHQKWQVAQKIRYALEDLVLEDVE